MDCQMPEVDDADSRLLEEDYLLESVMNDSGKAYAILKKGSGTHFDPIVVDAFFTVENEILSIKERYQDNGKSAFVKMVNKLPEDKIACYK
jgi:hypothetical protein